MAYSHCWCGCGQTTTVATQTDGSRDRVEGEPTKYVRGHGTVVVGGARSLSELRRAWALGTDVPYGRCWCGCGVATSLERQSSSRRGWLKGEPTRYLPGHEQRLRAKTRICRRYKEGEQALGLATEFGLSEGAVYALLRRRGIEVRNQRLLEWEEARAAEAIRSLPAYRRWREAVLERDGRVCQQCGIDYSRSNPLHAHHLLSFAEILANYRPINVDEAEAYALLWDVDNGVTLCGECHRAAHREARRRRSAHLL